jgi:stage II sporulation protein P
MRIRFYTRTQAICLALSLFLAVFVLGFVIGFALTGFNPPAQRALEAFAPMEGATPLLTAAPSDTPLPSQITTEINLFAISTPTPEITMAPPVTPSPVLTPIPSQTPEPTLSPAPSPGGFSIQVIRGPGVSGTTGKKRILIYHTHTREAYFETDESIYNAGEYQTTDQSHSLVAVGEALKEALETYGFTVIHDTTDHVPPRQGTAYVRSLQTMLAYKQQYPTLRVFIDLHRDAYGNGYPPPEAGQKDFVTVDGQECARVMCVVGTGESYDERPDYESNFKLAQAMTDELEDICDRFTRPVRVKSNRYNQHVSDMCLLIEVGHNANTLQQAENSAKYIALALSRVIDIDGG